MNLRKLMAAQAELDERIMQEHPELRGRNNTGWKILALYVELGECANEHRAFKKWSHNQKPNDGCKLCKSIKTLHVCKNPLLEEYVDVLHFALSIGNEVGIKLELDIFDPYIDHYLPDEVSRVFMDIYSNIAVFDEFRNENEWWVLFKSVAELGGALGFDWKQIERAYFDKNAENHKRQEESY